MNATTETKTRFQGLSVKIQNSGLCESTMHTGTVVLIVFNTSIEV